MADPYGGRDAAPPPPDLLDFYSDTKSKPTREMREASLDAAVGDEQKGEDPTTKGLLDRVSELLGKEDAIFLSSGTMGNEVAVAAHCRPGDEMIVDRSSHIVNYQAGGAVFAEAVMRGMATMVPDLARYRHWLPHSVVDGGYVMKTPENLPLIGARKSGGVPPDGSDVRIWSDDLYRRGGACRRSHSPDRSTRVFLGLPAQPLFRSRIPVRTEPRRYRRVGKKGHEARMIGERSALWVEFSQGLT